MPSAKENYQAAVQRITANPNSLKTGEVFQLPLFPDHQRAAPNGILRSALFRVTNKKKNHAVFKEIVASWPGWKIEFSGTTLGQSDLDVWMEVLQQSKQVSLEDNQKFAVKTRTIAKALRKNKKKPNMSIARIGGHDTKFVADSLEKLAHASVHITIDGVGLVLTHLIHRLEIPEDTNKYATITLDPQLKKLFDNGYTKVEAEHRKILTGDLTKWLHGYILSHNATKDKPSWIKLENLKLICGSQRVKLSNFKMDVNNAMKKIKNLGLVEYYFSEDKSTLYFYRTNKKYLSERIEAPE